MTYKLKAKRNAEGQGGQAHDPPILLPFLSSLPDESDLLTNRPCNTTDHTSLAIRNYKFGNLTRFITANGCRIFHPEYRIWTIKEIDNWFMDVR